MTSTEDKALAMVRDSSAIEALCRAIEQHEATKQEVERLNGLITATADHWLTLQVKHPIQWEGAINGAMAAACAEIEKHEAFRQEVSDAVVHCHACSDPEVWRRIKFELDRFIIPKPDPLLAAMNEVIKTADVVQANADQLRAALDALGFEIREKSDD